MINVIGVLLFGGSKTLVDLEEKRLELDEDIRN